LPLNCRRRWCLLASLIAGIGGCGGGGDAGGPDPAGVTCHVSSITPQEYTRSLPSQAGRLTTFETIGFDSYILLTIESSCLSGDCSGAAIRWESGGVFVGVRVDGMKLQASKDYGVYSLSMLSSNPPKEAQVWVRISGTYHQCVSSWTEGPLPARGRPFVRQAQSRVPTPPPAAGRLTRAARATPPRSSDRTRPTPGGHDDRANAVAGAVSLLAGSDPNDLGVTVGRIR